MGKLDCAWSITELLALRPGAVYALDKWIADAVERHNKAVKGD